MPTSSSGRRRRCSASASARLRARSESAAAAREIARRRRPPRHARSGHEPGTGQVVGGRKGLAVVSERRLFRNRRKAVHAACRHAGTASPGGPTARRPRARRPPDHGICAFFALSTPLTMKRRSPGRTSPRRRASRSMKASVPGTRARSSRWRSPSRTAMSAWRTATSSRVQIGAQGLDVAERDDQHDRQAEPPQGESGRGWAPPPDHGRAPFDRLQRPPSFYRAGRTDSPSSPGRAAQSRSGRPPPA